MALGEIQTYGFVAACLLGITAIVTFIGFVHEQLNKDKTEDGAEKDIKPCFHSEKSEKSEKSLQETVVESSSSDWQGELTNDQVKALVAYLDRVDDDGSLEKLLVTIANCCAFTNNQILFAKCGAIPKLLFLLSKHESSKIRTKAVQTLANLANCLENQHYIKDSLPGLINKLVSLPGLQEEEETVAILHLLVNMSIVNTWHGAIVTGTSNILQVISSSPHKTKTNALRLLVNLSCSPENTRRLLEEKVLDEMCTLLNVCTAEDDALRIITIIANILSFEKKDPQLRHLITDTRAALQVKLASLRGDHMANGNITDMIDRANQLLAEFQ
ncbi:predicted protein [Nematostella vectensis]|uniref:Armadillo repeat-containing domain-containing protein n=2 Tax=Nematostella vectensis TaxID=45351 RepID=A7SU43_NEMVE|nr:predicted protein [Nematostella vectensis]|eukprot:XP_001624874.1 predicted protein [Nematostella vectensis]